MHTSLIVHIYHIWESLFHIKEKIQKNSENKKKYQMQTSYADSEL